MMSGVTLFLFQITLSMYIHERVKTWENQRRIHFRKNTRRLQPRAPGLFDDLVQPSQPKLFNDETTAK